jgi:predicted dehydrogenase
MSAASTNESGTLRAGVIGLGWAGQQHMDAYAQLDGVELVALAGLEPDKLALLGDQYGVPPERRFGDWSELVAANCVDVVSVATPNNLHAPVTVAALDAGLHVLSEKPMADTGAAAQTMVDAARRNSQVLDITFNHRRRGDVQALKQVVEAGALGDIYYAKAGWLRKEGIPGLGSWFTQQSASGGGPLMDIGVHMLDMALFLLGEPDVTSATASTYAEFGPRGQGASAYGPWAKTDGATPDFDVEDLATAFLRLDGGGTLLLESSWAQWIPYDQCYVTLYGTEGGASIEWGGFPATYRKLGIWTEKDGVPAELTPYVPADGMHLQAVTDFVAAVRAGANAEHDGSEALARARVVDACYASAAQRTEVTLGT